MEARVATGDPLLHGTPLLALPLKKGDDPLGGLLARVDERVGGVIERAHRAGDLKGKAGESLLLYATEGAEGPARFVIIGVGDPDKVDAEQLRRMAGSAVRRAEALSLSQVTVWTGDGLPLDGGAAAQAVTEGALLAAWCFREHKTGAEDVGAAKVESVNVAGPGDEGELEEAVRVGQIVASGENFARTLQARPGNVATPAHLADEALAMAERTGLRATIMGPDEIRAEEMHALLAVNQGSDEEPRFIVLCHDGGEDGDPPLVLVGKGLTFDSGGVSLKPPKGMEDMKFDMSGGAAVIGAMQAIAELSVPANVVGVVPSTENLMSGGAMKPGDVIGSRAGKTIEVVNTDAEGRLILADALSYACSLKPAAVVDCATLTGSVVIALGHVAIGLMGTDEALMQEVQGAGDRSGERCWPLPLWDDFRPQLDSTTADFMNVGGRPGGSITAGLFLREFVDDEVPWVHLDIAGTAYGDGKLSYQRKGGYGVPARLLVEWVRGRAG